MSKHLANYVHYDQLVHRQQVVLVNVQVYSNELRAGFLWFAAGTPEAVALSDPKTNSQVAIARIPQGNIGQSSQSAIGDSDNEPTVLPIIR